MRSTESKREGVTTSQAPLELHYWPRVDIDAGRFTVSLCGEVDTPVSATTSGGTRTSYTCPDCMLRYSMLGGGNDA